MNAYLKAIVAAVGAAATAAQTAYPTTRREPVVTAVISALLVFIVPNNPNPPKGTS